MQKDMSRKDAELITKDIIYEDQFKIKLFFPYLMFTRVGVICIFIGLYFFGLTFALLGFLFLALYAYSKYADIKRQDIDRLFIFSLIGRVIDKGRSV